MSCSLVSIIQLRCSCCSRYNEDLLRIPGEAVNNSTLMCVHISSVHTFVVHNCAVCSAAVRKHCCTHPLFAQYWYMQCSAVCSAVFELQLKLLLELHPFLINSGTNKQMNAMASPRVGGLVLGERGPPLLWGLAWERWGRSSHVRGLCGRDWAAPLVWGLVCKRGCRWPRVEVCDVYVARDRGGRSRSFIRELLQFHNGVVALP